MPDGTGYERQPAYNGPRPPMATHWPAPPGGWRSDDDWQTYDTPANPMTDTIPEEIPDILAGSWLRDDSRDSMGQGDSVGEGASTKPAPAAFTSAGGAEPPSLPARSRPKHLPFILAMIAGVVVIGIMAVAVVATVASVHRYRQDRKLATVGMDQPVRDGAFQFTADGMRCGVHEIGSPDDYQSPTGQFCVITLTIKNVGTTPAIFADAIQKAYGPGGVWFSSDSEAGFYANPDPMIFFNDINPGNKVQALVVYDIPPSGHILRLEVHENPTTRGAIIRIS